MSAYAVVSDVEAGFRTFDADEKDKCAQLLQEAAVMIDACAVSASEEVKKLVSCRMVRRAIGAAGDGNISFPMGATQGSASALGYTQSWTIGSGSNGELYFSKNEKQMLGLGNRIGSYSPVEELVKHD